VDVTQLITKINTLPKELVTLILAMLPISELRGAIPYGLHNGIPYFKVLIISLLGNLLPVVPLYFFLNKLLAFFNRFTLGKKFSNWLTTHTLKKSKVIQVYKMVGLIIFVGIPLPMTGAWTGTVASVLLNLRFKYYIIGIMAGVLLAAIIMSVLIFTIKSAFVIP